MKVSKVFNNNIVSSIDEKGREVMVLGKGIGFQKKPEDLIDDSKVEKVFRLPSDITEDRKSHFISLVDDIPYEFFKYTDEIVKLANSGLGKKLNRNIYISLTDHIYYAVQRYREGMMIPNAMMHEIRSFYNSEFVIGLRAVELINEYEHVELKEDEAAFIALHIINSEDGMEIGQAVQLPTMLEDMIDIVRLSLKGEIDKNNIVFERFVTHLKYMLRRVYQDEHYPDESKELYESYINKEPEAYECAKRIKIYIHEKTGGSIPDEELFYLTLHISRISKLSLKNR